MLFILDDKQQTVGILSNKTPKACPYFKDIHTEAIENNLSTFEFEIPANHPSSSLLEVEGFIIYTDLDFKKHLFIIKEIEDNHTDTMTKKVYCENSAVGDMIGNIVRPIKLFSASLSQALELVLGNTGWEVGEIHFSGVKDIEFTDHVTSLEALHHVIDEFEAEMEYEVFLEGATVVKKAVNVIEKRGTVTKKIFEYGKDVLDVQKTEDTRNLVTALVGVGKGDSDGKVITFESYNAPKDTRFVKTEDYIADMEAFQIWNNDGKHIFGIFKDSEATNKVELFNNTKEELKKLSKPLLTYSCSVATLEKLIGYGHEKVRVGDTVLVKDFEYTPALILEARVVELERSNTDPSLDSVVLGDYIPIKAFQSTTIQRLQQIIFEKEQSWQAGLDKAQEAVDKAEEAGGKADIAIDSSTTANSKADQALDEVIQASNTANNALREATLAMTSANGKSTVFHGKLEPTTTPKENDIWFVYDESNTITDLKRFNGTVWVSEINVSKIDDAFKDAQLAITSANEAKTKADEVFGLANTANTNANTAITSATDAKTLANQANTATSTLGQTVDGIATKVTNSEGAISALTQTANGLQTQVNDKASTSLVTQISNNINLKVAKDDVITQINLSKEGILLDGARVHIKGTTTIDNGSIKSAHIESLNANKISAYNLSAISADLGNVTAGSITGVNITGATIKGGVLESSSGNNTATVTDGSVEVKFTNQYGTTINSVEVTSQNIDMDGTTFYSSGISTRYTSDPFYLPNKLIAKGRLEVRSTFTAEDMSYFNGTMQLNSGATMRTSASETGFCGVGGMGATGVRSGIAGVGVNFRVQKTYTPTSISLVATSNNTVPLAIDISNNGFWLYVEGIGTIVFRYWRGRYTA